ncbi:cholecystokinin receptor type A-like [Mya arenaria]|uniref:cholecystokinin receptor type A-like n=1 Tax=Mya arenaria TaxID=6604 RepID=UPI0022E97F77|nr:cholecystokinin receptor type A-like [Mya arenaria]
MFVSLTLTVCMLSVFSVCGIIGNVLVLGIYRHRRNTTARFFIITLAIADICSCLILIPLTIVTESLFYQLQYDAVCKMYNFLLVCNVQFSVFLMVIISIDRYFCICHPFKNVINTFRAKGIVICLLAVTSVFGIFDSWSYSIVDIKASPEPPTSFSLLKKYNNTTSSSQTPSLLNISSYQIEQGGNVTVSSRSERKGDSFCMPNLDNMEYYRSVRYTYASSYLISAVTVLVFYGLIFRFIHNHRSRNKKILQPAYILESDASATAIQDIHITNDNTISIAARTPRDTDRNQTSNIRTAAMLFASSIVFITTFLPAWLMALDAIEFNVIIFYMYFISHASNPFIYVFMSRDFRRELNQTLKLPFWKR